MYFQPLSFHTHTYPLPSNVCDDRVQTVPLLVGPLVSEVVTHVQVSEGEADVTIDLCGEVGIESEAFQVNTQHFGELDHTHLLLAVLETVCVCVCVCVWCV